MRPPAERFFFCVIAYDFCEPFFLRFSLREEKTEKKSHSAAREIGPSTEKRRDSSGSADRSTRGQWANCKRERVREPPRDFCRPDECHGSRGAEKRSCCAAFASEPARGMRNVRKLKKIGTQKRLRVLRETAETETARR